MKIKNTGMLYFMVSGVKNKPPTYEAFSSDSPKGPYKYGWDYVTGLKYHKANSLRTCANNKNLVS